MPIAPRMNQPVGPYDFWRDTLQPGLLGLYDRWTEQKPWPTPEQINAAVQTPGLLDREAMAGYAVDMAQPFAAKLGGLLGHMPIPEGGLFGITTWHGSPHKWTRPDISKVGTGEGAQAYGHGFYSADRRGVAESYARDLSGEGQDITPILNTMAKRGIQYDTPEATEFAIQLAINGGDVYQTALDTRRLAKMYRSDGQHELADNYERLSNSVMRQHLENGWVTETVPTSNLYKLDIPDEDVARYLDWDKPLSEQPEAVKAALSSDPRAKDKFYSNGGEYYRALMARNVDAAPSHYSVQQAEDFAWPIAADNLQQMGIPGIRYLDGSSRSAGEGTYNYVTFDPSRIKVLERNGEDLLGLFGISDNANTLPMDEASRAGRMAEMGHESGFWRGGKKAADGPWYARTKEGAAGFDRGDLREYSLKMDNAFSYGKTYTPEDLKKIKSALETRGYDQTAKYLLDIPGDYGGAAPGEAIVQAVKMATGPQAMGPIFKEAGFDVIDMGTELVVTHGEGTVRDAAKAAYEKAKKNSPDIFAGLLAPAVGLGAYGFLGPNDDSL